MTLDSFGLIIQAGSVGVLFLWLLSLIRGDFRTKQEVTSLENALVRMDQRIKDIQAEHILELAAAERQTDIWKQEAHDWQERAWDRLNNFAKPAVEALKERAR